jgi:hypothetical protein
MKKHFLYSAERRGFRVATVFFCALLPAFSFALQESTGPNGSNVQDVHALGFTGQGIAVGLISQDHARLTHEAFAGINSNNWYDATDQNNYVPSSHDTSVGGIICSRGGASYPNDKGAAPDVELYSFKVTRPRSVTDPNLVIDSSWIQNALDEALNNQCKVIVTGIQLSDTANGDSLWSLIYDYFAYEHNLVFATATGNYASNVTVFGDTYNSITTGGLLRDPNDIYYKVGSTSNSGPTSDARQKPDLVAPSENQWAPTASSDISWANASPSSGGQTSWSVPHTGGVAAVLLSYADTTPDTDDNQDELIKAVIVNSTFPNIQDKSGNATTLQTWDTDRGYGRIDAYRAHEILSSPKIIPSSSTTNAKGWAYDIVGTSQQDNYTVQGIKNERLLVTLTWNRRVVWSDSKSPFSQPGVIEPDELEAFFANLDLEIRDPDGVLISPAASSVDNLEKVDLLLSKTGNYQVRVINQSGTESANYALAFEVLPPLLADFNVDYVVNDLDLITLLSDWLQGGADADIAPAGGDGTVDLFDFSIFAQLWLDYDSRYYSP